MGIDAPVTIAGFSLGAMSAALIAAERSHLVGKLVLISPAAPLELGDFLPCMAGRPVFEAAQAGGGALRLFTAAQASLLALAPRLAVKAMFRRSPDADRRLLASPQFIDTLVAGLRTCLWAQQEAYRCRPTFVPGLMSSTGCGVKPKSGAALLTTGRHREWVRR
jgi:pimeloyl-ACP methyl ester carboxylesterase